MIGSNELFNDDFFCLIFRWFCHFDDDNYLNVEQLQQLLSEYDSSSLWYLGKPSVASPLEIKLSEVSYDLIEMNSIFVEITFIWVHIKKNVVLLIFIFLLQSVGHQAQFWFATGGAGFCISRPLAQKMAPVIRNEKLLTISDRIGFPDDVTIGFIIGKCLYYLKKCVARPQLKRKNNFHSVVHRVFAESAVDRRRWVSFTFGVTRPNSLANISQAGT